MSQTPPNRKTLTVESLVHGGRGLARSPEGVWLVDGGLPGETILAETIRRRPGLTEARLVEVLTPAAGRRPAPCPIQGRCGGCPWMVLEEQEQREWKSRLVHEALRRIGKFERPPVGRLGPSPRALEYRNRVELHFHRDSRGGPTLGFHGPEGATIDVNRCLLQDPLANRALEAAREFFLAGPGRGDSLLWSGSPAGRLILRRGPVEQLLVALRTGPGDLPGAVAFARVMTETASATGVVRLIARRGRRGGTRTEPLAGRPWIEQSLGGSTFRLPAASFFQVNSGAAVLLLEQVLELAGDAAQVRALDIYGGVGVYGLALARRGARVTVCEADGAAVECGREAAQRAGVGPVEFVHADAASFLSRAGSCELIVLNPPRTGFGRGVVRALAQVAAPRVVIVSCDPPTLARDARALVDEGYRLRTVVPVDLFPQTPHVEAVALLDR